MGGAMMAADIFGLLSASGLSVYLRQSFASDDLWSIHLTLWPLVVLIPCLIAVLDLYPGVLLDPVEEFRKLSVAITSGFLLIVVATFLIKEANDYSRLVILVAWPTSIAFVLLGRWTMRRVCRNKTWWGVPSVVVGWGADLNNLHAKLSADSSSGIRIVAVHRLGSEALPNEELESLDHIGADYAILLIPPSAGLEWLIRAEKLVHRYRRFLIVPHSVGLYAAVSIRECRGLIGFEVRRELLRTRSRAMKRFGDVVMTGIGGTLALPILLGLAVAVKLSSPGPIFYGQRRIGREGKQFTAWKFRTMEKNADSLLAKYLAEHPDLRREWEETHKLKKDPRVTAVGRFLRRTSLDELPQIWNVMKGEMSLVGPRPIVAAEMAKYGESLGMYMAVRPGITGLWQVSGRNNTTYDERVAYDVHYVRNWSIWLDAYLLVRTVDVVFRTEGAY